MFTRVLSAAIQGLEAVVVTVELSLTSGLPSFTVVGLPQNAVREGRERVVSALRHHGIPLPPRRLTINLAPADVRKEGSGLDLALAAALCRGIDPDGFGVDDGTAFLGELGLDGEVRPIRGTLSRVAGLRARGCPRVVVPLRNAREAAAVDGIDVIPVDTLAAVLEGLRRGWPAESGARPIPIAGEDSERGLDLRDVRGQAEARRALEIAATGGHNLLFVGPPGSGKSLLAARLPGLLPPLSRAEALGTTRVHSVAGLLPPDSGLLSRRPFRAPHHTVTEAGLGGGGTPIRPGEISLAHNGVLFLDELPEFRRSALELLREPLETGEILLSRASGALRLPARFILIAAMNPCPCGHFGGGGDRCTCPPALVERYRARVSGPLLDRIDLHVRVGPVEVDRLADGADGESTDAVATRVRRARALAEARTPGRTNARLSPDELRGVAGVGAEGVALFQRAQSALGLSARGFHRTLRVARSIADLAGSEGVETRHVAEALHFRALDRPVR